MDSEHAFELQQSIKKNEMYRRQLLAKNVEMLKEIRDNDYQKILLGDEEASWSAYLSDSEIFYTRNQIHTYMRLWNKYTEEMGLETNEYLTLPHSRLLDIITVVNNDNWEDWKARIETLTAKDWRIETKQAKGKITEEDEHEHDYEGYEICKVCGAKHKRQTVESKLD